MDLILSIPLWLRLIGLFCLGAVMGGQLNRGIYRLAYRRRSIGPWSPPLPEAPPRPWTDRLPIAGWWGLRREASLHGRGYWIRPLLIELCAGLGCAGLYLFEVQLAGAYDLPGVVPPPPAALHAQFCAHLLLISAMIVATFIDFDEQMIPDEVTVPGTLAGFLLAAALPLSFPQVTSFAPPPIYLSTLTVSSPRGWPGWLSDPRGLLLGLLCFWAWCLAIIPFTWRTRRGLVRAMGLLAVSFRRRAGRVPLIALIGTPLIVAVWWWGGLSWRCLYTSLVGMAFGGALIWAVRIIGSRALGQEAMGFGDVTLMGMIGAFTGWQATLAIFFLAPAAALFISVAQWLATRRRDIAFGPYLCLATLFLLLGWLPIWHNYMRHVFDMGWVLLAIVACCLVLMWAMLTIMRFFKELLPVGEEPPSEPAAAAENSSPLATHDE